MWREVFSISHLGDEMFCMWPYMKLIIKWFGDGRWTERTNSYKFYFDLQTCQRLVFEDREIENFGVFSFFFVCLLVLRKGLVSQRNLDAPNS